MTTPTTAPPHSDGQMTHRQILEALTGLLAALFTAILSSTIVANALPTIMSELKGTQTDFAWVITAALLANAVTTPIWGKLADLFNKKVLVQLSIVIFVAGSVAAGLAQNIPVLLGARVVQGIAMGGLTALAMAIIGTMIPPRERGRYSGYLGAVMAVATAGGPLLGGFIVDSSLGWRWTFFVCVPLAVIALVLLQKTLKIKHVKRPATIDWAGAVLLTAGVSLLLIWVSFAGQEGYYDWASGTSALMVGGAVVLLSALVVVEAKVSQPIIPLKIIAERTTALSIIASIAVGVAMFASSTYLGQYYQVARGATPTEAGLLTLPMIAGNLIGSILSGQLISRYGRWKRFLVAGSVLLIAGLGLAGTIDHETDMALVGGYTFIFGLGLGLLLQNLVLAVQNTVAAKNIGAASASVAFFRTVGGAAGVSVLGAVMGTHVTDLVTKGLRRAGIHTAGSGGASLDLVDLPPRVARIVRAAYGDGTALIFTVAAVMSVVALLCILFIKEAPLRRTVDIVPAKPAGTGQHAAVPAGDADLDREFAKVLAMTGSLPKAGRDGAQRQAEPHHRAPLAAGEPDGSRAAADAQLELIAQLQVTQRLLAEQQLQLSAALNSVGQEAARQRETAEQQARTAAQQAETAQQLAALEQSLGAERELQKSAAHYLAAQAAATTGTAHRD
ncbi:MFS transporter [Arthrobacter sp. I2-34]|uniref:MFS transporter n=1 Tax=Arthrobacter hankyongi TaxID=2904801 RepID=A0ABS9LDL7_9MICC|nr:MDR family MFS transporter [Arthrobacter hankyongi]MCG2624554.1 MFS transporter [Arthrobacter hankyongi]